MEIKPIATIKNDFTSKFAIPRQSGLAHITSEIIFEKEYADENALRGLEEFSHIWLIWGFSENIREQHALTVRPPRLGGNVRMGVFATRSPFRPNNLGLSCVKIEEIKKGKIIVSGADLMNGTPIYDIKPYIPYSDAHPEASGGFTDKTEFHTLKVKADETVIKSLGEKWTVLKTVLENDPRPAYQNDSERVYGFSFSHREIKFKVVGDTLTVLEIGDE
ncbi:MAG: tRNA (N6-threonylcarbamoyladenosine(37)-N6)-methyltransferase TrmO [Ruminococcaceae bacterium]|nr:tRNA (N6-threonylcarbamoyladenosine(37)-N6)-methyltransferase TrmO [Oscillospiraceae bacterium]